MSFILTLTTSVLLMKINLFFTTEVMGLTANSPDVFRDHFNSTYIYVYTYIYLYLFILLIIYLIYTHS